MGVAFSILVTLVAVGFLWFYVARPILEDYGVINPRAVNDYQDAAPVVMSRTIADSHSAMLLSRETDNRQTADRHALGVPPRDVMLNTFRLLRKYGIPREEARPVLKAAGWALDNNLWTEAAPPEPEDEDAYVTPIVGRHTGAQFQTDPDFPYRAP